MINFTILQCSQILKGNSWQCLIKLEIQHLIIIMESEKSVSFVSSTLIGRDEEAKLQQLLSGLINAYDSIAFREPVDWKALNLMDYPTIIINPMDLSTVKRKIATKSYENVEDCLEDINLIWENAKTYNPKEHDIHKLADKFEKQTKKMIRNYLPFVKIQTQASKKKTAKKQIKPVKGPIKNQEPKTYLEKQQQAKNELQNEKNQPQEPPHVIERKNLLYLMQLCSRQQIGVIFLLLKGNNPECLKFDDQGRIEVQGQKLSDNIVKRLANLMEMWGISFKGVTLTSKKR